MLLREFSTINLIYIILEVIYRNEKFNDAVFQLEKANRDIALEQYI